MEQQASLYSQHALSSPQLGKPVFSTTVTKGSEEIAVTIYDKAVIESSSKKKQYISFDFDLKFSFTASPMQITLERGSQKTNYTLKSDSDLQMWRQALKARLNQRGFHEQFKPKRKIGKGNFASVYLAEKLENGKNYAVKAFSKQAAYSEDKGKECLIKQIDIMRALTHKYCMKLHEVFESENSLYIVVELLEGGQLHDFIKKKYRFKSHEVRTIVYTILAGLKEMHSKNIMHRDLKPQNIILRSEGNFESVIADFGLAEFSDTDEYLFVRCGTPGYVAPEVINIKDMKTKYHPICDMFSLGLIFHMLMMGVSAFPGKTYNEVLAQNRASNFDFDKEQYKKVDPDAFSLMVKMLAKNPQDRITAEEALAHPYFSSSEDEEQTMDTIGELSPKSNYPNCESPLLTSSNPARKQNVMVKKDSCVEFVMGKENVFTGKVDTIAESNNNQISIGKKMESVIMPKVSKFSAKR